MIQENIFKEFRKIVSENANLITYQNKSVPNRRIQGQYGSDRKFSGYRSVLLYFQLNNKLEIHNTDIVYLLNYLERFLYPGKLGIKKYMVLFFNDNNNKLIFPGEMANNIRYVLNQQQKYFERYSNSYKKYSNTLEQISPKFNLTGKKEFPSEDDLCIFIYEKDNLKVTSAIEKEIKKLRLNCIWISMQKDKIVSIKKNRFE